MNLVHTNLKSNQSLKNNYFLEKYFNQIVIVRVKKYDCIISKTVR